MRRTDLGYGPRKAALERCGFTCYEEYLRSDLWKRIRELVLMRDHGICSCCEGHATQVHHLSYGDVTLRGDCLDKLVAICRRCHLAVEFAGNGNKLPFAKAVRKHKKLRKHYEKRKRREAQRLARELLS